MSPDPAQLASSTASAPSAGTPASYLDRRLIRTIAVTFLLPFAAAQNVSAQTPAKTAITAPLPPRESLTETRLLVQNHQYAPARARLESAIAANPEDAEARFLLGYVLFKQQHAVDSLRAYTEAARFRTPTPTDLITVASDYVLLSDFNDARHWLTVASEGDPSNPSIWYLLGRNEFNLDRPEAARDHFLTCLRLDPNHVKALYNLGLTYEHLHQPDSAITSYKQAITLQLHLPHQDSQPYLDLGMLLLSQTKPLEAITYLQTAARLAPSNPLAHQELARCLEALGRWEEAAGEMLICAREAPQAQGPPFFLGRIYKRLGREVEAKQQFTRAAGLAGTHSATDVPNLEPAE